MGHEFSTSHEIEVSATPEQVWEAIATGPGYDSWFMGRNTIEPGVGGRTTMQVADLFTGESTVTVWDPPNRITTRGETGPDGSFMAFEFLVEGRESGSTTVRLVHSGILGGDDWAAEYDALRNGDPLYLRTLGLYLEHFAGRTAVPVTVFGPAQPDEATVWAGLRRGLGITGELAEGTPVEFTVDGFGTRTGVVDTFLEPSFLGVRTDDGLYRFVGRLGAIGVGHHVFADIDADEAEQAWLTWLTKLYS